MSGARADTFGPAEFQAASGVSRETLAQLELYLDLLRDWNSRLNLVSNSSLAHVWKRHVWDSAQLLDLVPPRATRFVDLGTGAGFPGIVLAVLLAGRGEFVLYEAVAKKCRFLEEVAQRLGISVEIRNKRIETAASEPFDVVTARACAPLDQLLAYSRPFQATNTLCLFLKGQSVGAELTEAHKYWRMRIDQVPSRSDPSGVILAIRELRHGL